MAELPRAGTGATTGAAGTRKPDAFVAALSLMWLSVVSDLTVFFASAQALHAYLSDEGISGEQLDRLSLLSLTVGIHAVSTMAVLLLVPSTQQRLLHGLVVLQLASAVLASAAVWLLDLPLYADASGIPLAGFLVPVVLRVALPLAIIALLARRSTRTFLATPHH